MSLSKHFQNKFIKFLLLLICLCNIAYCQEDCSLRDVRVTTGVSQGLTSDGGATVDLSISGQLHITGVKGTTVLFATVLPSLTTRDIRRVTLFHGQDITPYLAGIFKRLKLESQGSTKPTKPFRGTSISH